MPPKRKFRELKTADEEKALLEKSVPKSTRYVKKWSFNIFAQWQNARLNKQAVNEEAGFDVERDKIQSLDTNIVNMTAESLRRMGNGIRIGMLSLLFVGQFCIFVPFCNGWNCDENDYSCFIKRHPY